MMRNFEGFMNCMLVQRMCSNILDADKVNPPKRAESGRLWTPAGVDLFRLLNEQVKVVQETSTDVMLFHVAVAINQVWSFDVSWKSKVDGSVLGFGTWYC
ncbi:hypothetical protein KC19_1G039300 [Ceratodon purpureus]|uniref:Uncharacterized protein n=1 Tax=Ceratodon purpureus TaxID=3225 RepID=A0A8T0J3H3_CERPU|nr:hypothetical protein KC19_1G039300 [Ceratodon purpureus]